MSKSLSFHVLDVGFSCYSFICIILVLWFSMHYLHMKILWLTLIYGGFLITKKILFFFNFLRHQCKLIINIAMACKSVRASWDLGTLTLLWFQTAPDKGTGKGDGSQGIRWTNYIPVGGLLPRAYLALIAKLALRVGVTVAKVTVSRVLYCMPGCPVA